MPRAQPTEPFDPGRLKVLPLTPERWPDLEALFGAKGAVGGCWCMWWRIPRAEYNRQVGEGNRRLFKGIVERGEEPGLLAYQDDHPVGWCAVAPRETFPGLENSRIMKRVDEQPVWSITCFFIPRPYRRRGIMLRLVQEAVKFARERGAAIVEAYPHEPRDETVPGEFVFTGLASAFRSAGFIEVARRSETRPLMRWSAGE
ncbi:MAG TPA: GNAT family N-acetyltransferase [Anaerolineaceae bacterium]|nr:GNAT family N-acetyltransferase [Anaerolineaceae bacterium]